MSRKTTIWMILVALGLVLGLPRAALVAEDDLLLALPPIVGAGTVTRLIDKHHDLAESYLTNPGDQLALISWCAQYPTIDATFAIDDSDPDNPVLVVPSRAAAFSLMGFKAMLDQSRTVAYYANAVAAEMRPHDAEYLNNLAFSALEFGYVADARVLLERALDLYPEMHAAKVNLAYVYALQDEHDKAADLLYQCWGNFPNEMYYLYNAAVEHNNAGNTGLAYALALAGQDFNDAQGVSEYDFAGLLQQIDYDDDPADPNCSYNVGPSTAHNTMFDANEDRYISYSQALQPLNTTDAASAATIDNVLYQCLDSTQARIDNCDEMFDPFKSHCQCDGYQEYHDCYIANTSNHLGRKQHYWNQTTMLLEGSLDDLDTLYAALKPGMTSGERAYWDCFLPWQRQTLLSGQYATMGSELAGSASDLALAKWNAYNDIYFFCTKAANSGPLFFALTKDATSLEAKFCALAACLSYDVTSGKVTIEASAGPAVKFTYDPKTERWGWAVGWGFGPGIGPYQIGGSITYVVDGSETGVEVKASLGPYETGKFFGFTHLPNYAALPQPPGPPPAS